MIYPTLEKYKGPASRHTCPNCRKRRELSRYVREDGSYLGDDVGKCNRATCGYHYTPRQYYAENPHLRNQSTTRYQMKSRERVSDVPQDVKDTVNKSRHPVLVPDYLDPTHLSATIGGYQDNGLVRFLFDLFPYEPKGVFAAVREYRIGTEDGFTVFPVIDRWQRFCKAQLIRYDRITGRRIKNDYSISSIQSRLKSKRLIDQSFETDKNVFFGEHLLTKYPGRPIALVEAPKTAVIASICKGAFRYDFVWMACLGKDNLNIDRLERLGRHSTIILYPDTDKDGKCIAQWREIASAASKRGMTVKVSDLIHKRATDADKAQGFDLADYLICEQKRRNDPANREAFRDLIEERISILIFDGGLSEKEAEAVIVESGFYQRALRSVLAISNATQAYEPPT